MRLSGVVLLVIWVSCVSGSRPCPENCKVMRDTGLPTCDSHTGTCSRGCKTGYYGNMCNMSCDINCQQGRCQQQGGHCACLPGFNFNDRYCKPNPGVKCDANDHCLNNTCLSNGRRECLEGCEPGWFGKFCQKRCYPNCVCDEDSGNCTDCFKGWYEQTCGSPCSHGCMDKNCHRNGTCVDGCKTGSQGERCEQKCSAHCVSGCDQLSGECVQCEAGRYGSTCQSQCSAGCGGTNHDCERDGSCSMGCIKNFYGEKCESCPEQCSENGCDINGTCSTCKPGFFGTLCRETCRNCAKAVCKQTTGECTKGCHSGFFGPLCNQICEDCIIGDCDGKTGECTGTWMPFVIGGGVLLIVVALAVFMACCLKRMRDIMKDGVDKIGQNTAVQFVPGHDNQLRSIDMGSAETHSCGPHPDDIYNHLFDIKPIETTFCLAEDDLETSSGYCAVRPLFRGLSGKDEIDNGSDDGSDGGRNIGRSLISLCDGNGSDGQEMKIDDEGRIIQEETQIVTVTSNEEGACGGERMEEEDETTYGCPTIDVGKHEEEGDDMTAVKINNTDTDEGDPNNDEMSIQPPDKGQSMTPEGQHTNQYVEVKVMKQF